MPSAALSFWAERYCSSERVRANTRASSSSKNTQERQDCLSVSSVFSSLLPLPILVHCLLNALEVSRAMVYSWEVAQSDTPQCNLPSPISAAQQTPLVVQRHIPGWPALARPEQPTPSLDIPTTDEPRPTLSTMTATTLPAGLEEHPRALARSVQSGRARLELAGWATITMAITACTA